MRTVPPLLRNANIPFHYRNLVADILAVLLQFPEIENSTIRVAKHIGRKEPMANVTLNSR